MVNTLIFTRHDVSELDNKDLIERISSTLESIGYIVEKKNLVDSSGEIDPEALRKLKEEVLKPDILISLFEDERDTNDEIYKEIILQSKPTRKLSLVLLENRVISGHTFIFPHERGSLIQLRGLGEEIIFYKDSNQARVIQDIMSLAILRVENFEKILVDKEQKQQQIEKSAASFVEESINQLSEREQRLLRAANIWNVIGFLSLAIGVIIAIIFIAVGTQNLGDWIKLVFLTLKSLIAIALLVATSRYSFNLAKTLMNESVKNADRIHAISFGKFYLQIFGETVEPSDVKDVFRDWNVANESNFAKLDSSDFDPKLVEAIVRVIEAVKSVEKTNKK